VDYIPKPFDADALRAKVSVFVELHQKNELLKQQAEELERSNTELQQFAYIASHDLREPLRVITGYLDLLKEDLGEAAGEEIAMYIGGAMSSAGRMEALIDDLLRYSRVGSDSREYVPVDLNEVVGDAIENLSKALEEGGAKVVFDGLPTVTADRSQIGQVVQNLVANSIKFRGQDDPRIEINAQREGERWIVGIADNGIGFEQKDASRVFEIFQRLHGAREFSGTGIGLAICKKIIDQHGGRIWAESEQGKGTTFFFSLPAARESR
jgi:light-regulated signal transduction histidine kinase (bacteriophytochrome)